MTELNSYIEDPLFLLSSFSFLFASISFIKTPLVCGTLKVGRRRQSGRREGGRECRGWRVDESSRGMRADCERTIGRRGEMEDGVKGSSPRQFVVKSELIF